MSSKITYNVSIIDGSITNPQVDNSTARDNTTPFSFLDFITITKIDYTPEEYNNFYINYLKEWAKIKNTSTTQQVSFVDVYVQFLKEIVLTYSTNQEKRFLSKLNFNNPLDLDIAIPFFVEKIRQIIVFYKDRRDEAQYIVERNKIRGNSLSIEKAIYEKIYQYVFAAQDSPSYTSLGITISSLQSNLKISIEEFADVYGNYFDVPPILTNNQVINLDNANMPVRDDPNFIVVDNFDIASNQYNASENILGNREVYLANNGIQTGLPLAGIVISDNKIIGANTTPNNTSSPNTNNGNNLGNGNNTVNNGSGSNNNSNNTNIINNKPARTFANVPSGTTIPTGTISAEIQDIVAPITNLITSDISDIQAAALSTSLSGGVITDLQGNIISDNTVFANSPVQSVNTVAIPVADSLLDQLNNTNNNPIAPQLYFPDSTYGEIFGSTAFLEGLSLLANVALKYDPICDPNNPVDIARRDEEQKTGLDSKQVADLKRKLLSKYMGVDFYFIDTTGTVPVSGILLTADSPSSNIPNLQVASTPTVPGTQLSVANTLLSPFAQNGLGGLNGFSGSLPQNQNGLAGINSGASLNQDGLAGNNGGLPSNQNGLAGSGGLAYNPNGLAGNNGGLPFNQNGLAGSGGLAYNPNGLDAINSIAALNQNGLAGNNGSVLNQNGLAGTNDAVSSSQNNTLAPDAQKLNIIDNRTNVDLTFGSGDLVNDYGFSEGEPDRSGTYYASDIIGTPLETIIRDNSLSESIKLLRNIGLFFKPDKIGLFKLGAKNFSYTVDFNKLEPQKIYIFPDPNVYGNVSLNAQDQYPIVYVYDHRPDTKNVSMGFAQGDPLIIGDEQAFGPYYAKEQSIEKQLINVDGLNLNFTDLYNNGYITKVQYDIYGNEYALFKDSFGQTFRKPEELNNDRIVSKLINGHVFYDDNEGYNFNYDTVSVDGTTIRTGMSTVTTNTVSSSSTCLFTLSAHPMTFFFREFILYQELIEDTRRIDPAFRDCGRFTFLDSINLPDPLDGDDIQYPAPSNYYYEELVDAGISSLSELIPPRPTNLPIITEAIVENSIQTELEIDIETQQTFADFTIDMRLYLSAGNAENYDCGYFTDNLVLQNDYIYGSNYRYYDNVSEESKTVLSELSASHNYLTQSDRNRLQGQLYVKNQAYSLSNPVSSVLEATFGKYSNTVKGEVYNATKDIDIVYDTIITETDSYLIFDKIKYKDGDFVQPGTKNTVFKIISSNNLNRFSNRFFHEDKRSIVFSIISPFKYVEDFVISVNDSNIPITTQGETPLHVEEFNRRYRPVSRVSETYNIDIEDPNNYDNMTLSVAQSSVDIYAYTDLTVLSSGNNKVLIPNIYEYNIKNNTINKIFPLHTQAQDLSGLFSLEQNFTETTNFCITHVKKPTLTYNSLNDIYKLSYIGVDNNNLFHLFDYAFFINNEGGVEFNGGSYFKHDKIVRTTDLLSTETSFASAYNIAGDYTITNGKLIL